MTDATIDMARSAAAARSWGDAYELLTRADAEGPLGVEDLELLATASYMVGRDPESVLAFERAHRLYLDAGAILPAVRSAFWIGMNLALRGEWEGASGWLGRAHRVLERHDGESPEAGYLLLPQAVQATMAGDHATAIDATARAIEIGQRFDDPDLLALAVFQRGLTTILGGDVQSGLRLLDEAMVAVLADELSPFVTGVVYCGSIEGCYSVQALRRAHRWTEALTIWCDRQLGMVAFTGQCLTHRAELLQLRGDWPEALDEARRAEARFREGMNQYPVALAHYRQGEVHRLRGEMAQAEVAYAAAAEWDWTPQPGLALLRLAEGNATAAVTALTTALMTAPDEVHRSRLLPAAVIVHLAADDLAAARAALEEFEEIAGRYATETLAAAAALAKGAVDMAEGSHQRALAAYSNAKSLWSRLQAPYETALAKVGVARVCLEIGDEETARREALEALATFEGLGARPDAEQARALAAGHIVPNTAGLTARELEVLAMVAAGRTNRDIASELVLSERTIDRHVSNILTKLGVQSRTGATAYAYEHGLL
ncbi:MAG: helix-turn-helix transcriptional regulator [Acidimicrobiia bacterium]